MMLVEERPVEDAVAAKQYKWRNHYFAKDGRCHISNTLCDSRAKAAALAQASLSKAESIKQHGSDAVFICLHSQMLYSEYSWHMQIPIQEDK